MLRCEPSVNRSALFAESDEASWRSGYAEDCKSLHPGSIPGEASTFDLRNEFGQNEVGMIFASRLSINLLFTDAGDGGPVFP